MVAQKKRGRYRRGCVHGGLGSGDGMRGQNRSGAEGWRIGTGFEVGMGTDASRSARKDALRGDVLNALCVSVGLWRSRIRRVIACSEEHGRGCRGDGSDDSL